MITHCQITLIEKNYTQVIGHLEADAECKKIPGFSGSLQALNLLKEQKYFFLEF